ncbi:MAG: hypothetical protein KAR45_21920 [Desulfobacteraceae bacterium]|nr:hypothetical protein [Desulfobacteraceae bacterium]
MIFKSTNQNGASLVELLMVMGTILILSATALVFYMGQMHKAHSIVLVHDLKRFSGHVQTLFLAEEKLPFEKGKIITSKESIKGFSPSKDVKMEIKELDSAEPYGNNPFVVGAALKKSVASINMKTHTIENQSEYEYEHFQNRLINFLSFLFSSVGLTAIGVVLVVAIIAIVTIRK